MSVIEKSELIKDAAIRTEILQFLKDPGSPGIAHYLLALSTDI
jgi:hypothetical protein